MKKVVLYGRLAKRFDKTWFVNAKTVPEILRAIDANQDGFLNFLLREYNSGKNYLFLRKAISPNETRESFEEKLLLSRTDVEVEVEEELHILPNVEGAGWVKAIFDVVVALTAKSWFFKAVLFAAISYGIQSLMKPPDPPKQFERNNVSTRSYIINGASNRRSQGDPVPIGYGRLVIGSSSIGEKRTISAKKNPSSANGKDKTYPLESESSIEYLELLCEGPIEGLVDELGNPVSSDGEYNKNLKGVLLNDVVVVDSLGQSNYVLTEGVSSEECKVNDGLASNTLNFTPTEATYIVDYGNQVLFGARPDVIGEIYKSGTTNQIAIAKKYNPTIFNHFVPNKDVTNLTFFMAVELMFNRATDQKSYTSSAFVDFSIHVLRGGKEYNIFDPRSGCSVSTQTPIDGDGLGAHFGRNFKVGLSRFSSQGGGLSVSSNSNMSKLKFAINHWDTISNKSSINYAPVELPDNLKEKVKNGDSDGFSTASQFASQYNDDRLKAALDSYIAYVDNNPSVLSAWVGNSSSDFFSVYGVATSAVEIPIQVQIYRSEEFGDDEEGISFKFMKITPELDPTKRAGENGRTNAPNDVFLSGNYTRCNIALSKVQEEILQEVKYPNTAFLSLKIDSRNFAQVPKRSYHVKLKKVLIPENYDPITRKYKGSWNGLFLGQKNYEDVISIAEENLRWTDNPAWIFFDVISNPRFGVSKYGLAPEDIDKWQLYKIAKYCDELVQTDYIPETSTGLLRPFNFNSSSDYKENENQITISLNDYVIFNDDISGEVAINETNIDSLNFTITDNSGQTIDRNAAVTPLNIDDIFFAVLGRVATEEEKNTYIGGSSSQVPIVYATGNNNESSTASVQWQVKSLLSVLLSASDESLVSQGAQYSTKQFAKEFGTGSEYAGKKVCFYIKKINLDNKFSSSSALPNLVVLDGAKNLTIQEMQRNQKQACSRSLGCAIEERILVSSDPTSRKIVVKGPLFGENLQIDQSIYVGGCCLQKNYPVVEPRFTCNMYITDQTEALNMLNSIASCFRSILAYNNGKISLSQDNPRLPVKLFTNSNVMDGSFTYSGNEKKLQYTSAMVRFNNKEKFFAPDVIYEEDVRGIQRLGFNEKETMGFGVTSSSQARRLAKWTLLTSRLETESIKFRCGIEGNSIAPGLVFQVVDEMRSGNHISGRVLKIWKDEEDKSYRIKLDRNFGDVLVYGRLELTVSAGVSQENYEYLSNKAEMESLEFDQDLDIDNIYAPQMIKFNCSVRESTTFGEDDSTCCLYNFVLKKPFFVDLSKNLIECASHGLNDGDLVRFVSEGTLPANIQKDRVGLGAYTVINSTFNTFQISEAGTDVVHIIDEGYDALGNSGGFHYFCPENIIGGEYVSEIGLTESALNQLQVGATYSLNGVNSVLNTSKYADVLIEDQGLINELFLNSFNYLKFGQWYASEFYGDVKIVNPSRNSDFAEGFDIENSISSTWIKTLALGDIQFHYSSADQSYLIFIYNLGVYASAKTEIEKEKRGGYIPLHIFETRGDMSSIVFAKKNNEYVIDSSGDQRIVKAGSFLILRKDMLQIINSTSKSFSLGSANMIVDYAFGKIELKDILKSQPYAVDFDGNETRSENFENITSWSNVLCSYSLVSRAIDYFGETGELSNDEVWQIVADNEYMDSVIDLLDNSENLSNLLNGRRYLILSNPVNDYEFMRDIHNEYVRYRNNEGSDRPLGFKCKIASLSINNREFDFTQIGAPEDYDIGTEFYINYDHNDEQIASQFYQDSGDFWQLGLNKQSTPLYRYGAYNGEDGEVFIFNNADQPEPDASTDLSGGAQLLVYPSLSLKNGDMFYPSRDINDFSEEEKAQDLFNQSIVRNAYIIASVDSQSTNLRILNELSFRVSEDGGYDGGSTAIDLENQGEDITPDRSSQVIDLDESDYIDAGINQALIINVDEVLMLNTFDSRQMKKSVAIKFKESDLDSIDLKKNIKIRIYGFNLFDGSLSDQVMNSTWNTILHEGTTVELLSSSRLYDLIHEDLLVSPAGVGLDENGFVSYSQLGAANYIKNNVNYEGNLQNPRYYRAVSVIEKEDETFDITGTEYNYSKFDSVDKDFVVKRPFMPIPPQANMDIPEAPESLILSDLTDR